MTIAEQIARLKKLEKEVIPDKEEDCARRRQIAEGGAITYDKVGTAGGGENTQELKNTAYMICLEELEKLKAERNTLKLELINALNSIFPEGDRKRRIAKLAYIDRLPLKVIANKHMHYDYGTIRNDITKINNALGIKNNDTQ